MKTSYKITITQINEGERTTRDWLTKRVNMTEEEITRHYPSYSEKFKEMIESGKLPTKEGGEYQEITKPYKEQADIYTQTVESLDIQSVISAVNKIKVS